MGTAGNLLDRRSSPPARGRDAVSAETLTSTGSRARLVAGPTGAPAAVPKEAVGVGVGEKEGDKPAGVGEEAHAHTHRHRAFPKVCS